MSLTLDDKQLLRSLSIMMVKDPKFARQLFIKFQGREQGQLSIISPIDKINNVMQLVINYDEFANDVDYIVALKNEINKVKDRDVRDILISSL
ncbi:hypothetical protein [Aeromonas caviae]|uniref:hypothetical protein n=1 Tax=Aeromonas caviae TaxID=648 RepID=UPI003014C4E2